MRHDTALVCAPCGAMLRRHLEAVALIAGDITVTVAKLARVTSGGGGADNLGWWKNPEALEPVALIVDLDAAARHDAAVGELSTWARLIAEQRGEHMPRHFAVSTVGVSAPRHPLIVLTWYLGERIEWLRHAPFADEAWYALDTACLQLQRVVDTHVRGEIQGLCKCGSALYGPQCDRCGPETVVAYSRNEIDAAKENYAVTASEAAAWIARSGIVADSGKLRDMIYKWRDRGFLVPVDETPRYRFGDVLDRVMASPALRVA
jgi:hypothetical protein